MLKSLVLRVIIATLLFLAARLSAFAAELPKEVQGNWTKAGENSISITANTSFEAGYGCTMKSVKKIRDSSDQRLVLYQVDMSCQEDGLNPPPA